jgi:hypothetical protein
LGAREAQGLGCRLMWAILGHQRQNPYRGIVLMDQFALGGEGLERRKHLVTTVAQLLDLTG